MQELHFLLDPGPFQRLTRVASELRRGERGAEVWMAEDEILVASAESRVPLFLERFGCLRPERHDATARPRLRRRETATRELLPDAEEPLLRPLDAFDPPSPNPTQGREK
jgi:hypothetical protein